MNKMRTIADVKARIHDIIQKEIDKSNREVAEFERKIYENSVYYGDGGWATQFEKAKKRREDYIDELKALRKAQGTDTVTDEVTMYAYSCPTCALKVMLNGSYGETVVCPVCERRIYKASDYETMKVVRGSRMAKLSMGGLAQLDSNGRFKD